jgi:hypothetical protein
LRRSYQMTPTVPCLSTAIAASKANALTPGSVIAVQVRPPSLDFTIPIPPEVGEVLFS